jgi:hypothetical protein
MLGVALVVLLTVVQLALAGIATRSRRQVEGELEHERAAIVGYANELAAAATEPAIAAPPATPARQWTLLDGAEVASTLQILQALGDAAGVTVTTAKAPPSTTPGRQSFQLNGRGAPQQVCSFLAAIEQHERLIVVESGRLSPGAPGTIQFELGLATHHRGGQR